MSQHLVRSLGYAGSHADGWLATAFVPEAADAQLTYVLQGLEKSAAQLQVWTYMLAATDDIDQIIQQQKTDCVHHWCDGFAKVYKDDCGLVQRY